MQHLNGLTGGGGLIEIRGQTTCRRGDCWCRAGWTHILVATFFSHMHAGERKNGFILSLAMCALGFRLWWNVRENDQMPGLLRKTSRKVALFSFACLRTAASEEVVRQNWVFLLKNILSHAGRARWWMSALSRKLINCLLLIHQGFYRNFDSKLLRLFHCIFFWWNRTTDKFPFRLFLKAIKTGLSHCAKSEILTRLN